MIDFPPGLTGMGDSIAAHGAKRHVLVSADALEDLRRCWQRYSALGVGPADDPVDLLRTAGLVLRNIPAVLRSAAYPTGPAQPAGPLRSGG